MHACIHHALFVIRGRALLAMVSGLSVFLKKNGVPAAPLKGRSFTAAVILPHLERS